MFVFLTKTYMVNFIDYSISYKNVLAVCPFPACLQSITEKVRALHFGTERNLSK